MKLKSNAIVKHHGCVRWGAFRRDLLCVSDQGGASAVRHKSSHDRLALLALDLEGLPAAGVLSLQAVLAGSSRRAAPPPASRH